MILDHEKDKAVPLVESQEGKRKGLWGKVKGCRRSLEI